MNAQVHGLLWGALLYLGLTCASAHAEGRVFALIGKSHSDRNFTAAFDGCQTEAAKQGDQCEFLAPDGPSSPRLQALLLKRALRSGKYAGVAISVTDSALLRPALRDATIPVHTYDSPFAGAPEEAPVPYVGVDNENLGRALARAVKRLLPDGGSVCIMSDPRDANLRQRVQGVRRELSNAPRHAGSRRLAGEGGWTEPARCPWDTQDSSEQATAQVRATLGSIKPDAFIMVGHWAVIDAAAYRKATQAELASLKERRPVVVSAFGWFNKDVQGLVQEDRVHALLAIDFPEIGRLAVRRLQQASDGQPIARQVFVEPATLWSPSSQAALGDDGKGASGTQAEAQPEFAERAPRNVQNAQLRD